MPGPFGKGRSTDFYYQFAGRPQRYVADWDGMPQSAGGSSGGLAAASHGLGSDAEPYIETPTYRVSVGQRSVLHSGPEQSPLFDAAWPAASLGALPNVSENEKSLMLLGVAALAWVVLRK